LIEDYDVGTVWRRVEEAEAGGRETFILFFPDVKDLSALQALVDKVT
jgi:hypothetical protein